LDKWSLLALDNDGVMEGWDEVGVWVEPKLGANSS
jgi:hypothetical protein